MKLILNILSILFVLLLSSYAFWTAFVNKLPNYEDLQTRNVEIEKLKYTTHKDGRLVEIKLYDSDQTYSTPTLQKKEFEEIASKIRSHPSVDLKHRIESNVLSYLIPKPKSLHTIYAIEHEGTQILSFDRSLQIEGGRKSQARGFFLILIVIFLFIYFVRRNRAATQTQPGRFLQSKI